MSDTPNQSQLSYEDQLMAKYQIEAIDDYMTFTVDNRWRAQLVHNQGNTAVLLVKDLQDSAKPSLTYRLQVYLPDTDIDFDDWANTIRRRFASASQPQPKDISHG